MSPRRAKARKPPTQSGPETPYVLRLFVTGSTPRSAAAIVNIMAFCKQHLSERCDLQIVDIFQNPAVARAEQIVATPTLIKKSPLPVRMLVGDLSDTARVLSGLDLPSNPA